MRTRAEGRLTVAGEALTYKGEPITEESSEQLVVDSTAELKALGDEEAATIVRPGGTLANVNRTPLFRRIERRGPPLCRSGSGSPRTCSGPWMR